MPHGHRLSEFTHPAEDGHQVMLAHGEHIDVLDDHHVVVVFVKDGVIQHVCGDTATTTFTVLLDKVVAEAPAGGAAVVVSLFSQQTWCNYSWASMNSFLWLPYCIFQSARV